MLNLAGYQETEQLYAGTRTLVYRAIRLCDQQPVIIKVLRNLHPNFNELVQFRNQYTIAKHLEHPGIVRPLALERYGNGYALIMPDSGAVSGSDAVKLIALSDYWQKSHRFKSEFLNIAIQLAEILHYLNQQRIVHKDIKPGNILICPQTHQIKLIDFSISSLLPSEQQQLINPNVLEGTLAYISPEQTGRMNRGIDYRTDFYSLGVTFYQLLTGKLPFSSNDPMELVHDHIAKTPIAPHILHSTPYNPHPTPQVLSEMVIKLMAKNAEDRYQSALGLKHDIEQCLQQLETTGEIKTFKIGQRDLCDRFSIPEKLYGRETEVQTLLKAFDLIANGATEMMLVAGFSGIGKTAVVNEVHKPIVKQRGYFIKGKFDQFNRNIPFNAFVQAFRDLMRQLLSESDSELGTWKTKILDALGENGQVIIDVVPELEKIVGQQPSVPELSGSAAQNRFNLLFGKFIRVFTTKEHPLTIFLDDLQWADWASLSLLKLLMNESEAGYLLFLGAYRDNEVSPAHPLILTLDEIAKQGANINTLTLAPLAENDITRLVADTLRCSIEIATPLSQLVYQKTKGNPFFTTQFLVGLHEDGYISFNADALYWQCDLTQVRQLSLTSDVVEFMVGRLQKLPEATQDLLEVAACIGNQFDLETLAIACDDFPEVVAASLWTGLQEGFVIPKNENYKFFQGEEDRENSSEFMSVSYRFLHDRVQQAAYSLIPDALKTETHLKIGQLLLKHTDESEKEEKIFEIVNQFNYGLELVENDADRLQVAELNAIAARKAKTATAYTAASEYLSIGRQLLGPDSWETDYELTLELSVLAAETAYLMADFEQMEKLAALVLDRAKTLLERVTVYEIKLSAFTSQVKPKKAVEMGVEVLQLLDVHFPPEPAPSDIQQGLEATAALFADKKIADFANAPEMSDRPSAAAMRILSAIVSPAYITAPLLLPLVILQMVRLSVVYGNAPLSAFAYGLYGLVLSGVVGDLETGYQFGELALQIVDRFNANYLKTKVNYTVGVHIIHGKYHVKEAIPLLKEGYAKGLETGELELGYSAKEISQYSYLTGENLNELEPEVAKYCQVIAQYKQGAALNYTSIVHQAILNLLGDSKQPYLLVGDAYDEEKMLPFHQEANDRNGLHYFHFHKLLLCYLFGEQQLALENARSAAEYLDAVTGMLNVPTFYFYDALARLAVCTGDLNLDAEHLEPIARDREILQKWASHAPMNFAHKLALVEAENFRVFGEPTQAMEMYDRAIELAKENDYIQEEALANELAAKFYIEWGKEKISTTYITDAYYCYARWEAKAKTDQLETLYPQLLTPILQQQQVDFNVLNSIDSLTQSMSSITQTKTSSNGLSDTLDFASLLQAAQTLSSTIELNPLLADICRAILTNAGAQKVVLLIPQDSQWQLRAIAQLTRDGTVETSTEAQPLKVESPVPIRLIHYVKNTQTSVVINQAKTEITGILEGYLLNHKPQSVLCLPLLTQGKLVAILYLEHPTTKGVFNTHRQIVVKFLCSQAAISLQNAQLYEQAQEALRHLQQAQLQLVQSEKMSALGNLVAGVAHEINNPTGFLQGNIEPAQEYVEDLLKLIDFLLQKCPNDDPEISEQLEEFELEFIREDFPELLQSMSLGVDRIRHISKSLRTFSRKDEEQKTTFKLNEGIDSTLLILKHRTKASQERPAIQIIKSYEKVPKIQCFPGQLNQVFMNILANAIDAFEEANQGKTYAEIKQNPNRIEISISQLDESQVQIRIKDNGGGMKPETQERIFEQGFTTKEVGKGTGLGMAIAHQIVTEKHGGTITCTSELGLGTTFAIALPIGK